MPSSKHPSAAFRRSYAYTPPSAGERVPKLPTLVSRLMPHHETRVETPEKKKPRGIVRRETRWESNLMNRSRSKESCWREMRSNDSTLTLALLLINIACLSLMPFSPIASDLPPAPLPSLHTKNESGGLTLCIGRKFLYSKSV